MNGYWHQWHWWYVPAVLAWSWVQYRFVNWIVRPDGTWRWQHPEIVAIRRTDR